MKKLITFSAFLCLFVNINAQIHKGSWLISGNVGTNKDKYDFYYNDNRDYYATNTRSISVMPKVGYFVNNHLCVGATLRSSLFRNKNMRRGPSSSFFLDTLTTHINDNRTGYLSVSPFVRYYTKAYRKIRAYAEFSPSFAIYQMKRRSYASDKSYDSKTTENYKGTILEFNAGLNYFLTPNIALEGSLGYNTNLLVDGKWADELNDFEFAPTLTIQLFLNTDKKNAKEIAAQYLKQGNITVGGRGAIYSDFDNHINVSLVPKIGVFISDRFQLGTEAGVSINKESLTVIASPFLKYYHPLKSFQLVGQAETGMALSNKYTSILKKTEVYTGSFVTSVGINKFITDNISIEGLLNLGYEKSDVHLSDLNQSFTLSLNYFMDKKWHKKDKK